MSTHTENNATDRERREVVDKIMEQFEVWLESRPNEYALPWRKAMSPAVRKGAEYGWRAGVEWALSIHGMACGRPRKGLCGGGPECWCRHGEQAEIDVKARAIYEGWKELPGWVPWVDGGNSFRQDDARAMATALMGAQPHD